VRERERERNREIERIRCTWSRRLLCRRWKCIIMDFILRERERDSREKLDVHDLDVYVVKSEKVLTW